MDLVLIRHCKALGQEPDAELTEEGFAQARELSTFLKGLEIQRIVSSPYRRALQTIEPFALEVNLGIFTDDRLIERVLSLNPRSDWMKCLEHTFSDDQLSFDGGESSRQATERGISFLTEHPIIRTVILTHGNLLALMIRKFNPNFGFQQWKNLSNPDVFHLTDVSGVPIVTRLWGIRNSFL